MYWDLLDLGARQIPNREPSCEVECWSFVDVLDYDLSACFRIQMAQRSQTLLQAALEPVLVQNHGSIGARSCLALKSNLHRHFAASLLTHYDANHRAILLAKCMSRYVVGDCEQDEWM